MKWNNDPARDALIMLLISLMILSIAGVVVGYDMFKEPPKEVSGKAAASGYVSLCMDAPPELVLGNMSCILNQECYYDLSQNVTNPENYELPIYYNNSPNDTFVINRTTGIINFTPTNDDEGNHTIKFCVSHELCQGVYSCQNSTLELYGNHLPNWTNVPDFEANETELTLALICFEANDTCAYNISLDDYVNDFENDTLTFRAELVGGSFSQDFPSFDLNSDTGIIIINNSDDVDVGNHVIFAWADDGNGESQSNPFNIEIINREEAPVWNGTIPHQYVCEDLIHYYRIDDISYDPDPNEDIDFYYSEPYWEALSFSDTELIVDADALDIGDHFNIEIGAMDFDDRISSTTPANFTVLEVNDEPEFKNYTFIEGNDSAINSTIISPLPPGNASPSTNYYLDINAEDEEDGNNLTYSVDFVNETIFIINSSTGEINFTPELSDGGEHNLSICIADQGLSSLHDNSSICNETGAIKEKCYNTSIFIGNNTAPEIINWTPYNVSVTIREGSSRAFEIEYWDREETSMYVEWKLDSEIVKNETVSPTNGTYPNNTYVYSPGYEEAGNHTLRVMVYDGEFNDSNLWEITVLDVPLTEPEEGSGGGGGGGMPIFCNESWKCGFWTACQKLTDSITYPVRGDILDKCAAEDVPEGYCGYQTRICEDLSECGTTYDKPLEIQGCYYSPNPNCFDGIQNCHHGSCELLVDCGGPCPACPTCSDGILNQGEERIDCGGPCPACLPEKALPPECGNNICSASEILTCPFDCWPVWITILFVLVTLFSFKKGFEKVNELKQKRSEEERIKKIHILVKDIEEAIDSKDIVLAKKLYDKARKIFKKLPKEEKLEVYGKLTESLEEIKKYEKK